MKAVATVSRNESPAAAGLRALFGRLRSYKIHNWHESSNDPNDNTRAQVEPCTGDVVASRYVDHTARHALVLDIDHPAWLVKSSTPGHFHLYIDVPDGIPHSIYMALLGTLADANVIEPGYARASQSRGFSACRYPWVKKGGA